MRVMFDRLSFGAKKVMNLAIDMAGGVESLKAEHLFLAILQFDPHLIFRKFRHPALDVRALIARVRDSLVQPCAREKQLAAGYDSLAILSLAFEIALHVPINTQHLLLGIILEGNNTVSHYLVEKDLCLTAFVQNRFPYLSKKPGKRRPSGKLVSKRRKTPEARAQAWLAELIPDQAQRYLTEKFVEVRSSIHEDRFYRIHRENCGTEILEHGIRTATACMHIDPSLPPLPNTDRVIAELFFLLGHEQFYLNTANITPV